MLPSVQCPCILSQAGGEDECRRKIVYFIRQPNVSLCVNATSFTQLDFF